MKSPEIIAERGVNYYDIAEELKITVVDAAKAMVLSAKEAGVNCVKFQTYKADKLAAENSPSYWDLNEEPTTSQRELFSKFDKLSQKDYRNIAKYCIEIGIEFMSTPFDIDSAKFINESVSRHKIASADITNFPLLEEIVSYNKPVLLSVGASTIEEVREAVDFLLKHKCKDIILLHCVLSYPTTIENVNLWKISTLKKEFPDCRIGYSDHTKFSSDILISAWLMGAEVIEKHFTLNKHLKGNDHYHAADGDDFKVFFRKVKFIQNIYGAESQNWVFPCEALAVKNARRGVYVNRDIKKGEKIQYDDLSFLRPQLDGLSPKDVLKNIDKGSVFSRDMSSGDLIKKEDLV